jgi:hypothetical protein
MLGKITKVIIATAALFRDSVVTRRCVGLLAAIPAAVFGSASFKKMYRVVKDRFYRDARVSPLLPAVIVKKAQPIFLPPTKKDPVVPVVSTVVSHQSRSSMTQEKANPAVPKKHSAHVKISARQSKTADIRNFLEQRRAAALAAKQNVSPAKTQLPRQRSAVRSSVPARLALPVNQSVVASVSAAPSEPKMLRTVSAGSETSSASSLPLHHKTACAYRDIVSQEASRLADFTKRIPALAEENPGEEFLRIRHLLALYRLHRYNSSVLEFMSKNPLLQTPYYLSLMMPLRMALAHFSERFSVQDVMETTESLRHVLGDFVATKNTLTASALRVFMNDLNKLLAVSPLAKQDDARVFVKKGNSKSFKDRQAREAYDDFVQNYIPEMKRLAAKIKAFDKTVASVFCYEDYLQAFGMLIMMSCNRLPTHVLARLRKNPDAYSSVVLTYISRVRDVRNIVAHRLEELPAMLVTFLCDRVQRLPNVSLSPSVSATAEQANRSDRCQAESKRVSASDGFFHLPNSRVLSRSAVPELKNAANAFPR